MLPGFFLKNGMPRVTSSYGILKRKKGAFSAHILCPACPQTHLACQHPQKYVVQNSLQSVTTTAEEK